MFAVHPLRVKSVAWVTERRDVLSGFQGKYADAIPVLRHVLAQRPDRPDAQAALSTALVKRVDELRREGRPGEADSLVRESAALARHRSATEALPKVLPGLR